MIIEQLESALSPYYASNGEMYFFFPWGSLCLEVNS